MIWDWDFAFEILPTLARAAVVTIQATLLGFVIAALLGLVFAIVRIAVPRAGWAISVRWSGELSRGVSGALRRSIARRSSPDPSELVPPASNTSRRSSPRRGRNSSAQRSSSSRNTGSAR